MPLSSWLFGEITIEATTIEITADVIGTQPVDVPASTVYFHDHTPARSLLEVFEDALEAIWPGVVVTLQEDRRVRIDFGYPVDIDWLGDTVLRNALGFAGNLAGSTAYVGTLISNYLWCPGLTEISKGRLGRQGAPVYDTQIGGGGGFTKPVMTTSNFRVNNVLSWRSVINTLAAGRVWALSEPDDLTGGEYFAFWHAVLLVGGQFTHYRALENDESSTDALTMTSNNRRGPYHWAAKSGDVEFPYSRTIDNVEARSDVSIPVTQVTEL